jgi:hypothetical protein
MIPKDLTIMLDSDNPITLSQFRDRNGLWAKDEQYCVDVVIEFQMGPSYTISFDDFNTLTAEQQKKVRHAPSSSPA